MTTLVEFKTMEMDDIKTNQDSEKLNRLAHDYYHGRGCKVDYKRAFELFIKASLLKIENNTPILNNSKKFIKLN